MYTLLVEVFKPAMDEPGLHSNLKKLVNQLKPAAGLDKSRYMDAMRLLDIFLFQSAKDAIVMLQNVTVIQEIIGNKFLNQIFSFNSWGIVRLKLELSPAALLQAKVVLFPI